MNIFGRKKSLEEDYNKVSHEDYNRLFYYFKNKINSIEDPEFKIKFQEIADNAIRIFVRKGPIGVIEEIEKPGNFLDIDFSFHILKTDNIDSSDEFIEALGISKIEALVARIKAQASRYTSITIIKLDLELDLENKKHFEELINSKREATEEFLKKEISWFNPRERDLM